MFIIKNKQNKFNKERKTYHLGAIRKCLIELQNQVDIILLTAIQKNKLQVKKNWYNIKQ